MHFYFISPHLDDAIFSAGNLIEMLRRTSKASTITIVSIFTQASDPPDTLFAKMFTYKSGYKNSEEFFQSRKDEDLQVCKSLGVKAIHLKYTDIAWRKKEGRNHFLKFIPELTHLYPTRFHILSEKVHREDEIMIHKITKELKSLIKNKKDVVIFCPLGIGNHIDHIIIRNICSDNFKQVIYWQDYPYVLKSKNTIPFIKENALKKMRLTGACDKRRLIAGYKSQVKAYFKYQQIKNNVEEYYSTSEELLKNTFLLK